MSRVKCLAILCLSSTAPISRPISALPRSGWRLGATTAAMRARPRSVAASRSSRLRARSAASARLRQTISRSPGNSGEVMAAISRSSNSDICEPPVLGTVDLHQFTETIASSAGLMDALQPVFPANPNTGADHPLPQGLDAEIQAVKLGQLLGRQGRAKIGV